MRRFILPVSVLLVVFLLYYFQSGDGGERAVPRPEPEKSSAVEKVSGALAEDSTESLAIFE